jgi:hypothetical protein
VKSFVICRDRPTYTRRCVEALLTVGLEVHVIDHGSTYPPMLEYLTQVSHHVQVSLNGTAHPREIWHDGTLRRHTVPGEPFIVTDCDIVPAPDCPVDWVHEMIDLLDAYPRHIKVGLSLKTDDLPEHYEHRERVQAWEEKYQTALLPEKARVHAGPSLARVYQASVDTTLAAYRWPPDRFRIDQALRMAPPYSALHLPWYADSANPSNEERYYRAHALDGVSHWLDPTRWET